MPSLPIRILALALPSSLALAAPALPQNLGYRPIELPWPMGAGNGAGFFGPTTTGDFTGDGVPDCVIIRGNNALIAYGPDLHTAFAQVYQPVPWPDGVSGLSSNSWVPTEDVGTLRGAAPGGRDLLVILDERGLHRIDYDPLNGSFLPGTPLATGADWGDSRFLRVLELDLGPVLVGTNEDGRTALIQPYDGAVLGAPWSINTIAPLKDAVALDWDGDGDVELALQTWYKVNIYRSGATLPMASIPTAFFWPRIAAVRNSGGGDYVALAEPDGSGIWYLTLHRSGRTEASIRLSFDAGSGTAEDLDLAGMVAGDMLGDGFDDLLLTCDNFGKAIVLPSRATSSTPDPDPHFVATGYEVLSLGSAPDSPKPYNKCRPVFDDLDGDGAADVAMGFWDSASSLVELALATRIRRLTNAPARTNWVRYESSYAYRYGQPLPVNEYDNGWFNVAFELPPEAFFDISTPSDERYTHVQITVYHQLDPDEPLENEAVSNTVHQIDRLQMHYPPYQPWPYQWVAVELSAGGANWSSPEHHHYYLHYRLVQLNGTQDEVVGAGETLEGGFTLSDPDYLMSRSSNPYSVMFIFEGDGPLDIPDPREVPPNRPPIAYFVEQSRAPGTKTGFLPVAETIQVGLPLQPFVPHVN